MANQVTTTFSINANQALQQLAQYQQQLRNTIQLQTQLGSGATNPGGGGGVGGGGAFAGSLGGLGGAIAGAVTFAAVAQGIKTVVAAAKESQAANRALAASAVEAGKSYGDLARASKSFADAALISESQAARSTAQLQRLVSLAGQGDQLERYQKGFLDLAAARGVAFEELDTLFQGIIAGTDDALNRFGKQDPSKLAEQYARSLGKTVEQLTEQEKILSRLKAFDTDFGLFNGANEDRINSFSGSVDRMNKSIDDIVSNLGKWATQSLVVADNIEAIRLAANLLSSSVDVGDVRGRLEAGSTPEQLAREAAGGPGALDTARSQFISFSNFLGSVATLYYNPTVFGPRMSPQELADQRYQRYLGMFSAEQRNLERDNETAGLRASQNRAKQGMDEWMARLQREAEAVRKFQESMRGVRDLLSGIAAQDNPFVKIFEDAAKAIERVRELTRGLAGNLQSSALQAVQNSNFRALLDARFAGALRSFDLASSAADFRSGIDLEGLSAQQAARRQMRQLQGRLQSIGAFDSGPTMQYLGEDATRAQRQAAERDYQEARRRFELEQASRDRQIIQLTEGFNPARLDSRTRELAASARERESARVSEQEREARALFANLNKILSADGIKVLLGDGEQVVRIVNEAPGAASVSTRPSQSATNGRYSN